MHAGVSLELKTENEGSEVEWDPDTKTLRLPLSVVGGTSERRSKLVLFTCDKCGKQGQGWKCLQYLFILHHCNQLRHTHRECTCLLTPAPHGAQAAGQRAT